MRLPEFQSDLRLYGEVLTHGLDSSTPGPAT